MIFYFQREFFISNGYFHTWNEVLDIQILDQKNIPARFEKKKTKFILVGEGGSDRYRPLPPKTRSILVGLRLKTDILCNHNQ